MEDKVYTVTQARSFPSWFIWACAGGYAALVYTAPLFPVYIAWVLAASAMLFAYGFTRAHRLAVQLYNEVEILRLVHVLNQQDDGTLSNEDGLTTYKGDDSEEDNAR